MKVKPRKKCGRLGLMRDDQSITPTEARKLMLAERRKRGTWRLMP